MSISPYNNNCEPPPHHRKPLKVASWGHQEPDTGEAQRHDGGCCGVCCGGCCCGGCCPPKKRKRRIIIAILLILLLLLVILVVLLLTLDLGGGKKSSPLKVDPSEVNETTLIILHISDVHARFEQVDKHGGTCSEVDAKEERCFGGFARLKTVLTDLRDKHPNVLFVAAGDFFVGTVWYSILKWEPFSALLPLLGLDVMSFGNHEFNDGIENVAAFLGNLSEAFPVVAANIDATNQPEMKDLFAPSAVLSPGGVNVGVVGYLTPTTKAGNLEISDEVDAVRKEAKRLRGLGVKTIIALGHSSPEKDLKIAKEVEEVDVVVGGHPTSLLYTGDDPAVELGEEYPVVVTRTSDKVPVVQGFAFTKYLGFLNLTLNKDGQVTAWEGSPILLDSSYEEDTDMLKALEPFRARVENFITKPVGRTLVLLDAASPFCRLHECNLGNLVTDAIVHKYARLEPGPTSGWTSAALAIYNSGGIKDSFDERPSDGSLTMKDLMASLPHLDTISLVNLTGSDVRKVFEHAVHDYDPQALDPDGHFLQVSGFKVVYNVSQPTGSRVMELQALCVDCRMPKLETVENNLQYTVAVRSFMLRGGDGYRVIEENNKGVDPTGFSEVDILVDYVKQMSPIYPACDERITFTDPL